MVPGSAVTVEQVHLGAERIGFLHVLIRMGADVTLHDVGGRRRFDHRLVLGPLAGTTVEASEIPSLDEVPILAVAALVADGPTRFRGRGRAAGQGVRPAGGDRRSGPGLRRVGRASRGTTWWSTGAPRRRPERWTPGATTAWPWPPPWPPPPVRPAARSAVTGWESVATSYPGFAATLDHLAGGDR